MEVRFGATWAEVVGAVLTAVGMYVTLVVLVRIAGQRSLATMSSFDLGCVVAVGALLGRVVLLHDPSLTIGMVALTTFFALQRTLGAVRRHPRLDRLVNPAPVLLLHEGRLLPDNLRRARVSEDDVRQRLRLAGVRRLEEVHCVVLERNGAVSVVRGDRHVDPWLVADLAAGPAPTR